MGVSGVFLFLCFFHAMISATLIIIRLESWLEAQSDKQEFSFWCFIIYLYTFSPQDFHEHCLLL